MAIPVADKNLGHATAYGYAKAGGYTGTEEEFAQLMASYATVAEDAEESALKAEGYAVGTQDGEPSEEYAGKNAKQYSEAAGQSATDAARDAGTANTKAGEASRSAAAAGTSALKAEGFATGKQNGQDVGSDSPYYENNAEYYAGQAASSATAAEQAAASITPATDEETAEMLEEVFGGEDS